MTKRDLLTLLVAIVQTAEEIGLSEGERVRRMDALARVGVECLRDELEPRVTEDKTHAADAADLHERIEQHLRDRGYATDVADVIADEIVQLLTGLRSVRVDALPLAHARSAIADFLETWTTAPISDPGEVADAIIGLMRRASEEEPRA